MVLNFTQSNYIVYESGDWKTDRFAVERTGDLAGEESGRVTIYSSRSANRSVRGEDYTSYTQEFTWGDGEGGKKEIFFQPLSDEAKEVIEYATATLRASNDTSTVGETAAARVYIIDSELKLSPSSPSSSQEPMAKEMKKGILPIYLKTEGIEGATSTIKNIDYIQNTLVYTEMGGSYWVYGRIAASNIQVEDPSALSSYHKLKIKLGIKNTIGELLGAKMPVSLSVGRSEFFNLRNQERAETRSLKVTGEFANIFPQQLLKNDSNALGTTRMLLDAGSDCARLEYFNGWTYLDEPVLMSNKPAEIDLIFSGQIPGELISSENVTVEDA